MKSAKSRPWTVAAIGDLSGRTVVVTGASAGIGAETARVLATHGARVVIACRNVAKASEVADRIRSEDQRADVTIVRLDLASLASVRGSAEEIRSICPQLDVLINNAGVMEPPYELTADGFELTFATNHLGHFALTGLLLDRLLATAGSRIVTMSSQGHVDGVMNFEDLQSAMGYQPDQAYFQSKLANLLFTYELDRRLKAVGAGTMSLACYPGLVLTDLFRTRSTLNRALISRRLRIINFWYAQDVRMGALPTLRAAVDPVAEGGEFYGPQGPNDVGYPVRVASSDSSHDVADQARLWDVSEQLTGVSYDIRA